MLGPYVHNQGANAAAARTVEQRQDPRAAADALCNLIHARCGVFISTDAMLKMFETDWHKLSTLAHAIHDNRGGC